MQGVPKGCILRESNQNDLYCALRHSMKLFHQIKCVYFVKMTNFVFLSSVHITTVAEESDYQC